MSLLAAASCVDSGEEDAFDGVDGKADAQVRYRFSETKEKCVDRRGRTGLNPFVSVDAARPCTDLRGQPLVYAYLRDKDLRGSVFGDNHTYGGALYLDNADLRYARFEALKPGHGFFALEADLRAADLSAIDVHDDSIGRIVELAGAVFDARTKLPKHDGVVVTATQAVDVLGMVRADEP